MGLISALSKRWTGHLFSPILINHPARLIQPNRDPQAFHDISFYAGQIRNQSWLLASTQCTCRRLRIPRLTWKSECTKLRSLRWRSAWQAQSCILGMNCCDYAFCVWGRTNSLQLSLVMLDILYLRCSYASTLERWDRRKEKERYPETKRALEWHYFK